MFETLIAAIGGISALFIGLLAWLHKRDSNKLKAERDAARADATTQGIRAEAKTVEAENLQAQQRREDATNAADSNTLRDKRNSLFK
jgi:hypothetical protein